MATIIEYEDDFRKHKFHDMNVKSIAFQLFKY